MLKHELSNFACIKWFMGWNLWSWYGTWMDGWL